MPIEILMPALSPTMTEGSLAKWLKKEGDEVRSGDVLAEIETDKATMEVEAADEGRIGKIIVPEGTQGVKVNQPIALLLEEGEDAAALDRAGSQTDRAPEQQSPQRPESSDSPHPGPPQLAGEGTTPAAAGAPPPPQAGEGRGGGPGSQAPAAQGNGHAADPSASDRIFVSPLARRMAQQAGLDLASLRGSGPQGRIVKADIDAALARGGTTAPSARPSAAPAEPKRPEPTPAAPVAASAAALGKEQVLALAGNPPYTEKPHTGMRRVIARRLAEAKQTIPHFYLSVDCEIDELLKTRAALNSKLAAGSAEPANGAGQGGLRISVNDFAIRAAALALRQVPGANASWSEDAILLWDRVDIAVAVALEDGLITPIVKGADQKGLAAIAAETRDLAQRARTGKLKLEEFQGGTFSISNLGMYGIRQFEAVINPPHGGILAVGAGEQRAVVRNGELAVATVMTCTLSCDHRVVDGAVGAQFLAAFKRLVEDPLTMLL
ncbi:MAG: pyruvate dehydrogenase complex dihydrolipoamide acetyltransferase [Alphaproteobacteria bacterium]|nr:pyruvate dehydrogenase complex dihydrolipoamide acetyltransferase [Alphaproteobacteria bacterium]